MPLGRQAVTRVQNCQRRHPSATWRSSPPLRRDVAARCARAFAIAVLSLVTIAVLSTVVLTRLA